MKEGAISNDSEDNLENDVAITRKIIGVNVIEIPRKVWLPKVKNEFRPEPRYSDVDEGYFIFERYGKAVFRSKPWKPGYRDDIIMFNEEIHGKDFKSLKINESAPDNMKLILLEIGRKY